MSWYYTRLSVVSGTEILLAAVIVSGRSPNLEAVGHLLRS
jgi:hypothetical protein